MICLEQGCFVSWVVSIPNQTPILLARMMGQWVWIQQCLLKRAPTSPATLQTPRTLVKKKKKKLAQLTDRPVLYQPCPFPFKKEVVKSIGLEFRPAHF